MCMYICIHMYMNTIYIHMYKYTHTTPYPLWKGTGWRRFIGSPKLQIIFHKRATKYRSLLREMNYKIRDPMSLRHPVVGYRVVYMYISIYMYPQYMYIYIYIYTHTTSYPLYAKGGIYLHTYIYTRNIYTYAYTYVYPYNPVPSPWG